MTKKKNKKQVKKQNAVSDIVGSGGKKRLERARKICRDSVRFVRGLPSKNHIYADGLDIDEIRCNRRIDATLGIMDVAKSLAEPLCPEIQEIYTFEEEWLTQNLMPLPGHDFNERVNHNLLATSLWMLDQLRDAGEFVDACQVFPQDGRVYDQIEVPDIWDVSHSDESIMGMLWTIQHRNDDCKGLASQKKKKEESSLQRYYLDDYTVRNVHRQDVPSRKRFEEILARIPKEKIDEAVGLYEDTFWDLVRRIYASQAVYMHRAQDILIRHKDYAQKAASLLEDMKNSSPLFMEKSKMRSPILAAENPFDMNAILSQDPKKRERDLRLRAQQMDSIIEKLDEEHDELDEQISMMRYHLGDMLFTTKENRIQLFGADVAAIWDDFQIKDPYALSFAFLYLIEENSDLPWVYGISVHLMDLCASTLPWRYVSFDVEEDEYWYHYNDEAGEFLLASSKALPKKIKVPELEEWYAMKYEDYTVHEIGYREYNNLAQILYEITGGIMPRNLKRYEGALAELDNYGISGKKALHPLLYCMTFLGESRRKTQVFHLPESILESKPFKVSEEKEITVESLQKQIQELQQENKQLRIVAHEAGREAREFKKKLESLETSTKADRQELTDLRELIFHQQEEIYESQTTDSSIKFPYTTRQRIVVFGGHDSWTREIKPRLPDVRFVDRTMLPNAELIRRADVVWIQTNSLSHAYFYKIIAEARKHDVPVRYFTYASAVKCAEQIVKEDWEIN